MGNRIVDRFIKNLSAPKVGNQIAYDSEIPGFGVRMTSNGVISFVLNYRVNGRERRYTIGRYPELTATAARERAIQLRGDVRDGVDPLAAREEKREEATIADLADRYLAKHAEKNKRAGTIRNDREMLTGIIKPKLGHHAVSTITRADVEDLHASLKATPYRANRVLSLLSNMFTKAMEWNVCEQNPAKGVERFPEQKRQRWLTVEEIGRLDKALSAYSDQNAANAIRLLLLTGAREGEVLNAAWEQFDLARGTWTKPSENTKQKRAEYIPLSDSALAILKKMRKKQTTGAIFPGAAGEYRVTLRRPWVQVCKAAGLVTVEEYNGKRRMLKKYRPTLRLHDLRHTYASQLASSGVSLHILGKLLGHSQPSTTARYAHLSDEAQRSATNKFGSIFKSATAGK